MHCGQNVCRKSYLLICYDTLCGRFSCKADAKVRICGPCELALYKCP